MPERPVDPGDSFERSWRQRFERFAQSYSDDAPISGWSPAGLAARLRHFRSTWTASSHGLWLDAGCGPGTYTRHLLEHGQRVVGVDYSVPSLVKARDRSPAAIPWIAADVQQLPLPRASFDGVLCFGVLQALSRPDLAIAELASAVRPGGWLWIDALNDYCLVSRWMRWRNRGAHALRYDSPREIRLLLEKQGFGNVRIDWVPIAPGSWMKLQKVLESRPFRWLLRAVPPLAQGFCHAVVLHGRRLPT